MNRAQFNRFFLAGGQASRQMLGAYPAVQETSTDFVFPDTPSSTMDQDAMASEREVASHGQHPVATSPYQQKREPATQHTLAPGQTTKSQTTTSQTTTSIKPVASTATSSKTTTSGFGWGSFLLGFVAGGASAFAASELSKKGGSQ